MKQFSASLVYTLAGAPLPRGTVTVDEEGTIVEVSSSEHSMASPGVTDFPGSILVPGFVNAHVHLELSHLGGVIPEGTGIGGFIGAVNRLRNGSQEEITGAARKATEEMIRQGIVAAGDISNTAITAGVKKESSLEWFTFVEAFGFHPSRAKRALDTALAVWQAFFSLGLQASVVPHAPYSVSDPLFEAIAALSLEKSSILSMHNQESEAENLFFRNGSGSVREHLIHHLGLDVSHFQPPGTSSLEAVLPKLPAGKPLLLVHNTHTSAADLQVIRKGRPHGNTWLVLCPNSNLYIEGMLPPARLFRSHSLPVCIGTDSLASNHHLSVFRELVTLHRHFPEIPHEELFTWASLNGARALGMGDRLGSLEPGKKPGLVLITPGKGTSTIFDSGSTITRLA